MKERLKTFLLMSLVGISLLFTKRLWIELPNETFKIFKNQNEAYSTSYLLSDMIVPNKYLLNLNEKNHTLFYDDSKHGLWTTARSALTDSLGSKDTIVEDLSNEEFSTYNWRRSIVFYFPEKVNTYMLAKALNVKDPNIIVDTIPNIESIYIYLGKGDPFFVFSYQGRNVIIYNPSIDTIKIREQVLKIEEGDNINYYFSMKEKVATNRINNDIYVPYDGMKNNLATVYVENEIRNLDEDKKEEMAEKFFNKSIDYIREIVENNGSTIYVYNQRVLKFNINGTLEYFQALEEVVKKRNLYESLNTAAEFISKNAGVTKGMYLAKVEEIKVDDNLGYNLTFRYRIRGIPVILGNEEVVDFVKIEVFNDHVRSYKHFIRRDMNKNLDSIPDGKKMLTSLDVINMNYDFIVERYLEENEIILEGELASEEVLSSIQDITLSYFDPCLKDIGDELIGVWVIRTAKGLYAFDVYNGALVYEKKQK